MEPVSVRFDRDEIIVTGQLAQPKVASDDDAEAQQETQALADHARIEQFREDTRDARVAVAGRAQETFERIVSWAVVCGDQDVVFTHASVPAMTRLVFEERHTLDTLIEAGVARSRSEALAWCVRLVAENEAEWIGDMRDALGAVEEARRKGPASG